jgi:hypothetical protein
MLIGVALLLTLTTGTERVYAQSPWPPFWFSLSPSYDNGKITYKMYLYSLVDGAMTDVTFKIPLPDGTRFLEGNAEPSTTVDFDGQEITVFTSFFDGWFAVPSFVLEVVDPTQTVFTTRAWITWKGDNPGEYLAEDVSIDITSTPLNWQQPPRSRLLLEASATATDDVITYAIYPKIVDWRPVMWDVKINVPVPDGTTFLSAEAPAPFVTDFDGREVSFFILQLAREVDAGPLTFRVSTNGVTNPVVVTHAWATWKNVGWGVGWKIPAIEETVTGDIIVQPHTRQYVVSDKIRDVPFSQYDLTSIALQEDGSALVIIFYTAGDLVPVTGQPVGYNFFVDSDCNPDTGNWVGVEYWLAYNYTEDWAFMVAWDEEKNDFLWDQGTYEIDRVVGRRGVAVWTPGNFLEEDWQFCWLAEAWNGTEAYQQTLPNDSLPDDVGLGLPRYEVLGRTVEISAAEASPRTLVDIDTAISADIPSQAVAPNIIGLSPLIAPSATSISGKIAVPLDNSQGFYDVHIFSLPNVEEIAQLKNGRQPKFHFGGQRLLLNRDGDGVESIIEYNLADGTTKQVSDDFQDSHPFYDPWGNRIVYGNSKLTIGSGGVQRPFIYVQCGLLPPHLEAEQRCRDIAALGILVPAGHMGEILGSHPVWTANNKIVYRGCDSWSGGTSCGIYVVESGATKGFSDGVNPRRLTNDLSDIPTDTKGNLIAFTSRRDGNWEAYVMDLNGAEIRNLSNSPDSNDGLPTISPDGNSIAFASDRDGRWAIWVVSATGGPVQKLFNLPSDNPWGDGDRTWTNERISWGP